MMTVLNRRGGHINKQLQIESDELYFGAYVQRHTEAQRKERSI